ncbi:unnamed protein product [Phyllotreta striolata]|uniref:Uncharacterized protein n=1 Tax=Phyllotreta striolata TaxID=444603 RepID=A0A9N9TEF3_PHYSR|nr:unnamed protein product [Phyllotreta striolata]
MSGYYTLVLLLSLVLLENCANGDVMSYGDFFKIQSGFTTEAPLQANIIDVKCKLGYIRVHRKCRKVY